MPISEEQFNQLEQRVRQLEEKKGSLGFPLDFVSKGVLENTNFNTMKISKLSAGLPIYTAARTDKPRQGEVYAKDIGGTRSICVYISGTEYCATLS